MNETTYSRRMEELHISEAHTDEEIREISRIHCLGWHGIYADAIPDEELKKEITEDRWVPYIKNGRDSGTVRGLLLYRGDKAVSSATYGPVRSEIAPMSKDRLMIDCSDYEGWGEIISLYTLPEETGRGYGSVLMEEVLKRLKDEGYQNCCSYVLKQNFRARGFYESWGFNWNGTSVSLPARDSVVTDLRYVKNI